MGRKIQYIGQYQMDGQTLGKGNFARVELATHGVTKCKVAIKVIDTRKIKEEYVRNNLHREASVMAQLRHPNIIRLYETLKATSQNAILVCLVTEYASGGELFPYIKSQKDSRMLENTARPYMRQLTSALHYLHERGVVHRDLKMENIMLDDKKKNIKIVDFGLSNTFSKDELLKTHCGSPEYAAPELFQAEGEYGPEVDIWSLGVIFYAAVIGHLPFTTPFTDQYRRQKLIQQINKGLSSYHDKEMLLVSQDCRHLLRQLIEPNPDSRLSLMDLEIHPWITRNGKMPFTPYQPPPKDKTMRAQVIEELSILNNMDKKYVGDAVGENRADELSAMFNMMMDERKKDLGMFDTDYTLGKEVKKDINAGEKKSRVKNEKRERRGGTPSRTSNGKVMTNNKSDSTMDGKILAEVVVEKSSLDDDSTVAMETKDDKEQAPVEEVQAAASESVLIAIKSNASTNPVPNALDVPPTMNGPVKLLQPPACPATVWSDPELNAGTKPNTNKEAESSAPHGNIDVTLAHFKEDSPRRRPGGRRGSRDVHTSKPLFGLQKRDGVDSDSSKLLFGPERLGKPPKKKKVPTATLR